MQNTTTNVKTVNLVQYSLMIAMVFAVTYVIQVPMPWAQGGLVHIGDIVLFAIALIFGKKKAAVAGGFGMMLFDILSSYTVWAPFTLIVRFMMGYVAGTIAFSDNAEGNNFVKNVIAIIATLPILIGGYYIAEGIIYGNWITPVNSIPGNIGQFVIGLAGALPIAAILNRVPYIKHLKSLDKK